MSTCFLPIACTDGKNFEVQIPSPSGATRLVTVPVSRPDLLARILMAQAEAASAEEFLRRVGNEASPTEYMVEQWLRSNTPTRPADREAERRAERAAVARARYGELFDTINLDLDF